MANSHATCSIDGCEKKVNARGMCAMHYNWWKKENPRKCKACGGSMKGLAPRALYCSEACRVCKVEGCGKPLGPSDARQMCQKHYRRWANGIPLMPKCKTCGKALTVDRYFQFCSEECRTRCKADGCKNAYESADGYCAKHDALLRRTGSLEGTWEWREAASEYDCRSCGEMFKPNGQSRKFCSVRCWGLWQRHRGVPSLDFTCGMCGKLVKRDVKDSFGVSIYRKICDACRQAKTNRHHSSPGELAMRDGADCGICGDPVDMTLKYPDLMRGSVDHIIPVALGGPVKDKSNLQLAHLRCNLSKRDKLDRPVQMALSF